MEDVAHGVALEANYPWEKRFAGAMVLEIAVIHGGYGWIFPKGDHVNVGVGGNEAEGPKLRAELRRMCEAYGIDPDSATDTRGYRLPMRAAGTTLARGTTAVIGDAAGLVDPFSGDGMYEAFYSAKLVTEAALDVLAGRAEDLSAYQTAVERRIVPLTRAGWGAKAAFERFPRTTYAIARLPVTFRALEKLLTGDLPRAVGGAGRREGRDPRHLPRRQARRLKERASARRCLSGGAQLHPHARRRARRERHPSEARATACAAPRRRARRHGEGRDPDHVGHGGDPRDSSRAPTRSTRSTRPATSTSPTRSQGSRASA